MSITSKSPRKVAAVALAVGNAQYKRYGHRFSRHDFTLAQLFACLVLRKFFRTDYRGIAEILEDWPQLCKDIGFDKKVPHFTTLQKAEKRLLTDALIKKLLTQTVALGYDHPAPATPGNARGNKLPTVQPIDIAAADSTGFQLDGASRYFIRRRSRSPGLWQTTTYRPFGKLGIVVDCDTHLILSTCRGMGPRPDVDQLRPLMDSMCTNAVIERMLADAGYDSQHNHELLRDVLGIDSLIPATIGRPTNKLPRGHYRWLMATDFDDDAYGQRWQVETVFSMIKRNLAHALAARTYWAQSREIMLLVITHNLMILWMVTKIFYRVGQLPFSRDRRGCRPVNE